ncbi:CGNR zinc finger domain-containing protein [Barrientosiimonas humi]|uniref:CGNR zinc finger domain-containing protein n=1 Tax=Barrientosiimonas humi TaxID=999931 RepID=UPI00370D2E49
MTTEMHFNSHVRRIIGATVALVNALSPGEDGGRAVAEPAGAPLRDAVRVALTAAGYESSPTQQQAQSLLPHVRRARSVFGLLDGDDLAGAAELVNRMLRDTRARPELDLRPDGGYGLHFHGPDDSFERGWAAGIAAGLAMAIGGDLGSRLGVCAAPACDRVYVDLSKNAHRRFCSTRCQNRVKAAAHRARRR